MHRLHYFRLLYYIKVLRITKGLEVFEIAPIMHEIKHMSMDNMDKKIKANPEIGEDQLNDHHNINLII